MARSSTSIRRRTLAQGIYADAYGITAIVEIGSKKTDVQRKTKRYPLDTDLDTIIAWRLRTRADLIETEQEQPARQQGTLAGDVPEFLKLFPEGPKRERARYLIGCWTSTQLGQLDRYDISEQQIRQQLIRWDERQLSVSQLNQRLSMLKKLYTSLGHRDTDGPFPTDNIKGKRPTEPEPRSIPMAFVQLILDHMPNLGRAIRHEKRSTVSLTKIRLRLMAFTGIPPAQLQRIRVPQDLQLHHADGPRVYVRPRRKGQGSPGAWLPLFPPAVDAFRDFVRAGIVGQSWNRASMWNSWKHAVANTTRSLQQQAQQIGNTDLLDSFLSSVPPDCRPYDLRHSFATEAYRLSGDIQAVADLLQHSDLKTTRRYTKGAVSERSAVAVRKMTEAYETHVSAAAQMISAGRAKQPPQRRRANLSLLPPVAAAT